MVVYAAAVVTRRVVRRSLITVAGLLAVLLIVAAVTVVTLVRRPFPALDGTVALPGLSARVTVLRDARGVPQLYADTADDLFRAQGYVHAQDRFFEMDWRRHITAGRLSELVGADADALQADKVVRTLGWRQVAQSELAQADPATRRYLAAYAQGVNDYLEGRSPSQLALNYTVLGITHRMPPIEPWTPVDSLAWFKALAWDLRGNYADEVDRARAFGVVKDVARVDQLYPGYPYDRHDPILSARDLVAQAVPTSAAGAAASASAAAAAAARATLTAALAGPAQPAMERTQRAMGALPGGSSGGDGIGSNSWVVSGAHTSTGKPLLANDPHLAPGLPGIWYQVGLHCRAVTSACPFDVTGFSFAGVPGVMIGHNARIAWGMTNLGPDVTDLYLEQVRGQTVLRDGRLVPLTTHPETIKVAGGAPVTITVRSGPHGPLLSDVIGGLAEVGATAPVTPPAPQRGDGYAVALAWTALIPGHDMDAVFAIDAARDFPGFRAAALLLDVPAQNLVYADVDGHIGYQAPGRIPIRPGSAAGVPAGQVPTDGTWPLPGWTSAYDWKGFVPLSELPWTLDPPEGFVVAANQAVTPPGGRVTFTHTFDYGYRSQRIRDLISASLTAGRRLSGQDMERIQTDTHNGIADDLVPLLLKAKLDDPFYSQAVDLLRGWDGTQPVGSAAAAFFNAVWSSLLDLTFDDELPAGSRPDGGGRWFEVVRGLLKNPTDPWWDIHSTPSVVESRDEIIRLAIIQARDRLTRSMGKDPATWSWGRLHQLDLSETPLGKSRATGPLHPLLNRGAIEMPGGTSIVDALAWDAASGGFSVTWAPSMRMVVDLASPDGSRWVNQTGESGHPGNAHYTDQLDAWAAGRTYAWPFTQPAVQAATRHTLTLTPRPAS